jgi:hypothetical protein
MSSIRIPADVMLESDREHMNWLRELAKAFNATIGLTDGDKGDITVSSSGTVWTVDAGAVSGRFLGYQVINSGVSYAKTTGTNNIIVEGWGGGAAGGGAPVTAAATSAAGSGGGSGSYFRKRITGLGAGPFTVAIGAGGTGVSGGTGNSGGSTTFNDGTTTYTAPGGTGGTTTGAGGPFIAQPGGAGGVVATNGDVNGFGAPGQMALVYVTTAAISGAGGSTSLGGAGAGVIGTGAGVAGVAAGANTGSGGGGAAGNNAAAQTGGAGGSGRLVVWEFT